MHNCQCPLPRWPQVQRSRKVRPGLHRRLISDFKWYHENGESDLINCPGGCIFWGGRVMVFPIQEKVERAPPPTTVHTERFEDLAANSFKVTIAKVQQTALSKAGGRLHTPAEQLAMITKRRTAKKGRTSNAKPSSTLGSNSCICYDQCLIGFIPWLVFWSFEQNELSKDIWHLAPDYRAGRMDSWDPKAY